MRIISTTQVVRQSSVSNARKKRTIFLPNSYINVQSHVSLNDILNNLRTLIVHRHATGWLILALDSEAGVMGAWSDCKAFQPLRTRYMPTDRMTKHCKRLIEHERKKLSSSSLMVYTNDATLLFATTTTIDTSSCKLIVYQQSNLIELMRNVISAATTTKNNKDSTKKRRNDIPSYAEIRKLDSNITLADYRAIYI